MLAYAKANPGKLTFGSASSLTRAGGVYFTKTLGFDAPVLLYKGSADIAAALGKSEGAVRVILHRSLIALRKIIGAEQGGRP